MAKLTDERIGRQSTLVRKVKRNGAGNGVGHGEPIALTSEIRTALAVARDYPVFPCDGISKSPLTKTGFKEATQDAEIVARWWRRYPQALIGVPTGSLSGLVAIDCDPKSGDWFQRHRAKLGTFRMHRTRRGKHLLYQYPEGSGIRISKSSDTIDVRGEGGYVVWWPAHGGEAFGELGELPGWLSELCKKLAGGRAPNSQEGGVAPEVESRDARKFKEGGRNDALSARAYHYRKMGLSTREIGQALLQYDLEHCEPPYQHTDGKDKVLYIARKKNNVLTEEQEKRRADEAKVELLSAADVPEERVDWLWKGFLARNKLHLLSGAGGSLKSTLTLEMAKVVSTGGEWPDGTRCRRGNVILWTGEDDLGDTVKPRLRFAGADQTRVYFVDEVDEKGKKRAFNPAVDMEKLSRACAQLGEVSLVIIDPAISVVQRDSNSAAEVRKGLDSLIALGRKHKAAVLGIHHVNKGSKGKTPGERVTGSGAWTQAPRLSLMVGAIDAGDDKVPNRWVFFCEKTQGRGRGVGYEYTFEEEPKTELTRIAWGRRLEGSPQSILAEAEGTEGEGSKIAIAVKFLKKLLSKGSVNNWEIHKQAEDAGIRGITLTRAAAELKVIKLKAGKNSFRWGLPEEDEDASRIPT